MAASRESERALLLRVARQAMVEHGLEPDFPPAALAEAGALSAARAPRDGAERDLRALPWCSIDNDDSRDLDQLTVADAPADGCTTIRVAVADVSATVAPRLGARSPRPHQHHVGLHAAADLPDAARAAEHRPDVAQPGEDRLAVVVEIAVGDDGVCGESKVYRAAGAQPREARLPCGRRVAAGRGPDAAGGRGRSRAGGEPEAPGRRGAAAEGAPPRPRRARARDASRCAREFDGDTVGGLAAEKPNRAKNLIEDFMIAANGIIARFLEAQRFPVLRRVVRSPERWQRIVALAGELRRAATAASPTRPP